MPRRLPDSDSDSQKENQGEKTPMSKTRVKAELGAIPGSSNMNRAASRVDSDDDLDDLDELDADDVHSGRKRSSILTSGINETEDENGDHDNNDDDDDEEGETESPNGRKRVRINEDGDAMPAKARERVKLPRRVTLPRDRDGSMCL